MLQTFAAEILIVVICTTLTIMSVFVFVLNFWLEEHGRQM